MFEVGLKKKIEQPFAIGEQNKIQLVGVDVQKFEEFLGLFEDMAAATARDWSARSVSRAFTSLVSMRERSTVLLPRKVFDALPTKNMAAVTFNRKRDTKKTNMRVLRFITNSR